MEDCVVGNRLSLFSVLQTIKGNWHSKGLDGLIRSTWDQWSSNSETGTVSMPLGILALEMSAKIRYCQVTILTQCTKWKAVQPIGRNWRLLDSASRGMCASMPGHVEQWCPFHIHVKLCHDIALDLSYLHWNCIVHCAAAMCCWKHRQVHRFAVWTFTCPSWPGIRSGNYLWFPSAAQTWTTQYCEV